MSELNIEQIREIIPQKEPFIFIDRVLELEDGVRVVAIKNVTMNENFFQGHFPKQPVMPGMLILEAMAQTSIILYHSKYKDTLKKTPNYYLGSVKANFKHPVVPGDQLRLQAQATKLITSGAFINVKAYVGDAEVAEAELVFAVKQ